MTEVSAHHFLFGDAVAEPLNDMADLRLLVFWMPTV